MLDIRIIVDLHHHKTVRRLLEVDTVESVADRSGRSYGEVDYVRRRLIEIEGAVAAFARRTVGTVLEDLPMSARHAILAYEQRLARQYADPPIVLRRQKLLRQNEIGFLEQLVGYALELVDRGDLVDAARERTVRDLDHQRQAELVHGPRQIGMVGQHDGRRRRHLVGSHELHQEHLVHAADHRDRIIDHRHALLPGAAGEPVGVVVD